MASERIIGALALALLLASCGVEGPPLPPEPEPESEAATRGISLDGWASVGVAGRS